MGKEHGSDATFDGFESAEFHMNAPATVGPLLRRKFAVLTSRVVETQHSEDGTVKLLVRNCINSHSLACRVTMEHVYECWGHLYFPLWGCFYIVL